MESHTDTATVEAPEVESTEAVESLPQESTQDSFLDALDTALSNLTDSNLGDAEAAEPKEIQLACAGATVSTSRCCC